MLRTLIVFGIVLSATTSAFGATASCRGSVKGKSLYFEATGSLTNKNNGRGLVKIDGRTVAHFDGDEAKVSYLRRSFTVKNQRGDFVSGKLNNIRTGASTLTKMELPGEGISLAGVRVQCRMH